MQDCEKKQNGICGDRHLSELTKEQNKTDIRVKT